ncbi:MAG: diacylglycerol kinase family lipid kinase, partial [Prolixibacteraceae bacterium]|nr:diacylglycerol kinase family lipid kinase [Prolixibacteraceae bacterium]
MEKGKKEKWVFIVNPTAGNYFAESIIPKIKQEIDKYKIDAEILITERKGHATTLAAQALEKGYRNIVAVGGDGTLNEVGKALVNNTEAILGIIPAGTGNDFIQILGFPNRFSEEHWDIFFSKNTALMDVGICNGNFFFNGMGLGFDAQVASRNYKDEGEVKKGGKDKYIWHIVSTLLFYREKNMKVLNNSHSHETKCFINTVSIGRRFAGDFFLTPQAIANDGELDVCSIKKLSLYHRFRILMKVPKGSHVQDKRVNYFKTKSIELEFDHKVPYHLDGELLFSNKFEVSILPQAVKTIFNPKGKHFFT